MAKEKNYEFENLKTDVEEIRYSRYIASWFRSGGWIEPSGDIEHNEMFVRWLKEEHHLTDDEITDILLITSIGKSELEHELKDSGYIKKHGKPCTITIWI